MDVPARSSDPPRSCVIPILPSITVDDDPRENFDGPSAYRRASYTTVNRHQHQHPHHSPRPLPIGATPMPIPNAREEVPPPLPPPKHIADPDIAWQFGRDWNERQKSLPSIRPGSSLLGGLAGPGPGPGLRLDDELHKADRARGGPTRLSLDRSAEAHRTRAVPHGSDEGYASLSGLSLGSHTLKASQSSVEKAYDQSLVDKLNPVRSARLPPFNPHGFADSGIDLSPTSKGRSGSSEGGSLRPLPPLSRPDHGALSLAMHLDDPTDRRERGPDSATSTGSKAHAFPPASFLGPRPPVRHGSGLSSVPGSDPGSRSGSGSMMGSYDESMLLPSRSQRGSNDRIIYEEPDADLVSLEESQMKQLRLADGDRGSPQPPRYSPGSRAGQKRRASSPPREGDERLSLLSGSGLAGELYPRRSSGHLAAHLSPTGRFPHGSLSSASSVTRTGSTVSSTGISLVTNSLTSVSSHGRASPGAMSPGSELDSRHGSPFVRSLSLNPSPRGSLPKSHQRAISDTMKTGPNVRKPSNGEPIMTVKHHPVPKLQGVHICECCPKKPKRFDTAEGLRVHETEKQYTCQYCHNRFKNKNEAERHQNSLHLRRHSWSCAALASYQAAFHPSPFKASPGADVCGYCGQDFSVPANWDVRIEHLTNVHKFGECNQAKKFFRADHFRQHLKHSHAGTSGKWTNMLENACMKDEPAADRRGSGSGPEGDGGGGSSSGGGGGRVSVIDEELEET